MPSVKIHSASLGGREQKDDFKTDNITMQFGGVTAVNLLNIEINEHEIVALIGPNGAGKTTAFNMITGVYTPTSGDVIYTDAQGEEQKITGKRPSEIAKMGVARTFQNIRLFKNLSVYENVMIAKHLHLKSDFMSAALHLPWYNKEQREMEASVEALLRKLIYGSCAMKRRPVCRMGSSVVWRSCVRWQLVRVCCF